MNIINRSVAADFATILSGILLFSFSTGALAQDCPDLADLRIEDTNFISATEVPASGDLPAYCRILGYVRPAINFEIRLPTTGWNGKFYMAGCGGYCGTLESEDPGFINAINYGLKRNYAVSTMDGGHWGKNLFDARWAYHDRLAEIDWAYRAVHETARITKMLIKAYYGQDPEQSYFAGCSTGGRQAVMEAMRYPDDFDGVISGCPHPKTGGTAMLGAWLARANTGPDGKNLITPVEVQIIQEAVYEACDSLDGLEDGLISDPRICRFDPATLACEDSDRESCLTANQIEAVKAFYAGPRDSEGRQLYAGLPLGSEPYWDSFFGVTGETADAADDFTRLQSVQFLRYMAFREDPGETYTIEDFNFDRDPQRMEHMAQIYDANDPDLTAFHENGGKLLMWHAWADPAPPPMETIAYYEAVEEHVGSREHTQDFFRLFMIPGMNHCGIGDGPGISQHGFDPLTALERWVEQGKAPERLLTTKTDSAGNTMWTRPVCPYPQRAVYDGEGDLDDDSNFECINPEQ
ncbi:MAG: tannase/feruloyl esterase family alpha/beta hydrolase [Balneolaceae bacterium]|nr:tannase/feruloyl esterase family alpha/beta hydrolase [Balneolaceae bacterium]